MHERALRTVLLVRAIEESDPDGQVLPLADREEATVAAMRENRGAESGRGTSDKGAELTAGEERLLVARAERLCARVEARSPVVGQLLSLAGGVSRLGNVILLFALALGASLAALDGSRRIDILAFPLVGLVAWNLLVYVLLIAHRARARTSSSTPPPVLARFYERWVHWRTQGLLARSSQFNAPLAAAFRRFAGEWISIAHPLLILRARRLFHLAAVCVAIGLIAGLYVRGIALRYEAGWESTFLGPVSVRAVLLALYGPASALSGIALPESAEAVDALRWTPAGGADAAMWIHLIAWTAMIYIVLPRLAAALAATLSLWRASRRPVLPPSLHRFGKRLIGGPASLPVTANVLPYSYQPSSESSDGLTGALGQVLGEPLSVEHLPAIAYGEEDAVEPPAGEALNVLLFSLAATPEAENHGAVIANLRDRGGPLLVVVDEAPLASRVDASMEARLAERRELWRTFLAGYRVRAFIADLSGVHSVDELREVLESAA